MSGAGERDERLPEGAVAIVGMAGRFPGAPDVRALWRNLLDEVESIRRLDDEELERAGVPAAVRRRRSFVPVAADLPGIERFDAEFFGLAPREARVLDPQQKLLLELAWEACEDAGVVPRRFPGALGVFVGASRSDWTTRVLADPSHLAALGAFAIDVATGRDFLATRLAFALGGEGPCLTVQTACSTSLVAVHLAVQSLLAGECDLALAGGASIRLPQAQGYLHVEGGVASRDGHCRSFDARASGTVAANGGALVCLRRLEDALEAGDPLVAVLRGSAVTNDGAKRLGFTAPSAEGQRAAIEEALAVAGLEPDAIGYVEAHGTATPLGDPIELAALRAAFAGASGPCALGSLKTNLGHLDAAAGVAGLVKAALCVAHGRVPASLHFERPNPALELERSPFRVARASGPWIGALPRRAGVSSFGIGGTNAHAIVEEPPERAAVEPAPEELLVLSAATPEALAELAGRLAARLAEPDAPPLAETAWTLASGRRAFRWRASLVARERAEARARLTAFEAGRASDGGDGERPCAFLLAGQGALPLGAVRSLARSDGALRASLESALAALEEHGLPARAALLGPPGRDEPALESALAADTALAQPLLFALELALAERLASLGLVPAACVGHSLGELVAATLAGVFARRDALSLVVARGRLMAEAPPGVMLSAAADVERLRALLVPGTHVAATLAARVTVLAGEPAAMARLEAVLEGERIACARLPVRHAFHTRAMDEAAARFGQAVAQVERHAPRVPWVAGLDGEWITPERARDPEHWAASLRRPVRLDRALARLAERDVPVALELGPPGSFVGLRAHGITPLALLPRAAAADGGGDATLLGPLGRLWERGVALDWRALDGRTKRRVSLPTYPFQRRRSWIDEAAARPAGDHAPAERALAQRELQPVPARRSGEPRADELREGLAAIWREILGVSTVAEDADFLALGGSSLAAIQLAAWIHERLGLELAPARLAATPGFGAQLALLRSAPEVQAEADDVLVELAAGPPRAALSPLVLVHGIDGELLPFAPLARVLGRERAVLGLRPPAGPPAERIDALAARYDAALRRRLGEEPAQLAGHSFGALVALELARRLDAGARDAGEARGPRRSGPLVLLDARPLAAGDPPPDEAALRARAHALVAGRDERERLAARLVAHARAAHAAGRERPTPLAATAVLVLAAEGAGRTRAETVARWRALVGDLRVLDVAGDHLSFLARPPEALVRLLGGALPGVHA